MTRVLVIDDSLLIREIARSFLERHGGFVVQTAESGAEGVLAAIADRPDAILLDVEMPEMDGPATVHELRRHPESRGIPVVLITGRDAADDRLAFSELGVAGVIAKPFAPAGLVGQVRAMLGWAS